MAEAPIQELSSANKIRELAGMPIEAQPAPRQEEPPAWSEIKDSEDYKTLTYPEQVNLARQWGAETKQYAASLQDYTPEQDAQIDDFVNKDAVDVPTDVKIASGAAGLVKGSSQLLGGIAGGLGGGLVGGPVGAIAGGVGGAIAGGELAEAGLQKFTPNVARSREFAPGYATAGEYAPAVVAGTVGGAQLVQASKTLFRELGVRRGVEELGKAVGTSAAVGAGVGSGVRGITGGEVSPGTIAEDALFGALFAGLGSGTRVKGYNREQAISLNERVKAGKATEAEYRDWNGILAEAQKTGARGVESAKRTTVDLAGRPVFEKTELTTPPMRPMPTAELPPIRPAGLPESGVRGNVRGTQADTAEMQRRGIPSEFQESLIDLDYTPTRPTVFTIESQGGVLAPKPSTMVAQEPITTQPTREPLQGEIVSEGPLVTPRTQLPSTERLALPAEGEVAPVETPTVSKPTIPRPMRGKSGEAGFIVSDVQEGAAKVAKKWLTTEGNLPKEMFDIMESKGSRTQAMLKQIDFTLKDLAKEARILNGKPRLTPEQSGQLYQFLRGTSDVTILPEPFQPIASQMRRQLDNLSEGLIQVGAFSQEVGPSGMSKADIVRMNKEQYLTRSYEREDNPKYTVELVKKRDPKRFAIAENFVRNQMKEINPAVTEAEVQGQIKVYIEGGKDKPFESLIQASGIGKKLGITKARQDIPEQIRYLMGEYTDPVINYARSASKMINLLQSQRQLNELKNFGVANKLFFERPTGNAATQIAADGSDTRSPLNGLYAEKELVDAIENFEMMHKGGTMYQLYSMANAWVKWGKTVGSIQAQFRNPISNVLIEVANGNIAFGGSLKPIKTVLAEFGVPSMDTKEGRAYLTRATQLGVYDNTVLNEFTQMLKDAQQYKGSTMDFAEDLAGKTVSRVKSRVGTGFSMIQRGAKNTIDTLNKTYRAGDNLFKLMAWENETKQLMDGRKISRQEAEVIGAERVKNTRPTYSRVPKLIKALRLQPIFGNFISWPSEMLRCLPNTVRYAAEDMKTPGMRKYGISRMMYMIAATTAVVGITKLGMWATDFTGRKMTALRRFVAPYQKNASLMPTGSDGKDVGYVDLSYTDPYEVMRGPFQAVMSGRDPEDSIYGAIKEFLESYIGPSILANSIASAIYGKTPQGRSIRNPQDTFLDQRLDDISYLLRQNEPATVSQIRRIGYALTGQPDTSVSKYGRVYKPSEELSALFGIRPQSLNISKALESKASRFNTNMTDVGRIFTETYGAVGNVPESKIREQFSKMENRRKVMFDEANKDFHAAMLLGLSRSEAISAMRVGGLSGDNASAIANNKYRDYRISKSLSKQMRRELSPEEMQKRQEIGRELMMKQGE
jgi:hypothetical protein